MRPLIIILSLAWIAQAAATDTAALNTTYQKAGRAVVDATATKKIDAAMVEAQVLIMTQQAVPLARAYAEKHPHGRKLIDTVIAQVAVCDAAGAVTGLGPMQKLAFDDIEKQWHNLEYFKAADHNPGLDVGDEKNEHFTDPLHTMIHPIMVLRAARDWQTSKSDKDLGHVKAEMEEGLEQCEKLTKALKK